MIRRNAIAAALFGAAAQKEGEMKQILLAMVLWMLCAEAGHAQYAVIGKDTIPAEVETAYVNGLKFLVSTQKADGSWGDQAPYGQHPAVVGAAVLAMLAHGDDPDVGPYKDAILRGIRFIIGRSNTKTGQIDSQQSPTMYNHGFAMLALAEAYGVVDEPLIGPTLQQAIDFLMASQKRNALGAWRYKAESTDADTTVAGAQMVGLFAARNAGLNVPDEVIEKGLKFYKSCQDGNGSVGYMAGGGGGGGLKTTTAIGVLVYTLARQKETPFYRAATGFFKSNQSSGMLYYHEYYAAQAAFHCDEATWQAWNTANIQRMIRMQDSGGGWSGGTVDSSNIGVTFNTAFALLSLALNYRYLPIYER